MVSALAPGYTADTNTAGGAISGNRSKGNLLRPSTPTITSNMEITVASTGLFMNILNMMLCFENLESRIKSKDNKIALLHHPRLFILDSLLLILF
jgi:hypothetical protein